MKQIAVLSGKGGAGKTSLVAVMARLADFPIVLADCDVDAANLALTFSEAPDISEPFLFGQRAKVKTASCTGCGACVDVCRFDAVRLAEGVAEIRLLFCEGCRACQLVCDAGAIEFVPHVGGRLHVRETPFGALVHAELGAAEGNSGKLVASVKEKAKQAALDRRCECVIIDGPPGIGCPVHATLAGVDLVVAVTEPTPSGASDLERLLDLCEHFRIPAVVVVNKYDLSLPMTEAIEREAIRRDVTPIGRIGFDKAVPKKLCSAQTYLDVPSLFVQSRAVWQRIRDYLG